MSRVALKDGILPLAALDLLQQLFLARKFISKLL